MTVVMSEKITLKEFKEAIHRIGINNGKNFTVTEGRFYYHIDWDKKSLASVGKTTTGVISTTFEDFVEMGENLRQHLFDVIYKLANTPIEERGYSE